MLKQEPCQEYHIKHFLELTLDITKVHKNRKLFAESNSHQIQNAEISQIFLECSRNDRNSKTFLTFS